MPAGALRRTRLDCAARSAACSTPPDRSDRRSVRCARGCADTSRPRRAYPTRDQLSSALRTWEPENLRTREPATREPANPRTWEPGNLGTWEPGNLGTWEPGN